MTNSKLTKRALLASSMSLLLCFAMLLGTTFAWFTDSAVSGNNIIKAGNLDMKLSYKPYGAENTEWKEVKEDTVLFGEDALYEPGYTEAVWLKVENLGSLAFRYDLAINVANEKQGTNKAGEKFSLSDHLEVRYMTTTNTDMERNFYTTRESLDSFAWGSAANSGVASLKDKIAVINNGVAFSKDDAANGAYNSAYVLVVISMPTTVGNEANHNGNDIPEIDFTLTAVATQLTYEKDSFGSDYDKDAFVADYFVTTADELIESIAGADKGETIGLMNNIKIDPANMSNAYGTTGININGQILDGNGNTLDIKGAGGTWDSGINTTGGTIRNLTVTGSFRGIFINHNSPVKGRVILENVIIDGTVYTISCDQGTGNGLTATNCTFKGWTSFAGTLGDAKFINCTFGAGSGYNYSRPYAPTTYVGCNFEAGHKIDARAAVILENCTLDGVALTDANLANLVTGNIANATVK